MEKIEGFWFIKLVYLERRLKKKKVRGDFEIRLRGCKS